MHSFLKWLLGMPQPKVNWEANTSVFPDEYFSLCNLEKNGKPVIGSFNMNYRNYHFKADFPWCLKLMGPLDIDTYYENGMTRSRELQVAAKMEDQLQNELMGLAAFHFVGHCLNGKFLDGYVYLDHPEEVREFLDTQISDEYIGHGFHYELVEDPEWKTVSPFLS